MRFATNREAVQNRGERARASVLDKPGAGLTEPLMKLGVSSDIPPQLSDVCAARYSAQPWYGQAVKNSWPGVKGTVRLGVPVVDKFGEIIVIYRNENGFMKSASLGRAPGR